MSNTRIRFCPKGHDKDALGRTSSRSCAECSRAASKSYRERHPARVKAARDAWAAQNDRSDYHRAYKEKNVERVFTKQRRGRLKSLGWSYDRYNWQVMAQGLKCAICKQIPEGVLHADHNHETGAPRALLCSGCNTGLGSFRDNPEALRKAAEYVELA